MVAGTVVLVTLRPKTNAGDSYLLEDDSMPVLRRHYSSHGHHHAPRHPPPIWGQSHLNQSGPLAGVPMLVLVTTRDISIISRSIESVLQETAGSGIHLVVSVPNPSQEVLDLLQGYPLKIHIANNPQKLSDRNGGDHFWSKLIPSFSAVNNFKNIIEAFSGTNVCMRDILNPLINILSTGENITETSTYALTLEELRGKGVPYEQHPYNPLYRKAVINSRDEIWKDTLGEGVSKDRLLQAGKRMHRESSQCQHSKNFKEALQFVKTAFTKFEYLMLLETGYALSPNFVSYFSQTLAAMKEDPSIYCISAHNPLASPLTSGNITSVYRFDHFVAKATLIPSKLVTEILEDFVIYEETKSLEDKSALESLEIWLSWWSRRRRRGCVVPDVPRICRLQEPGVTDKFEEIKATYKDNHNLKCLQEAQVILTNTSRLLHYQYSQDLYESITAAEPLGGSVVNCNDAQFFPHIMNASAYIIYMKMENYDDDFTFHHVMKCFGLDLPLAVGYFEGIFQFTFRHSRLLLMGIPYSRFSPSIKNADALIVADIPQLFVKGIKNYLVYKNHNFTFNTVLVKQNIL
nr:uncharacterized protein LOC123758263 [Procambarus clarkii]